MNLKIRIRRFLQKFNLKRSPQIFARQQHTLTSAAISKSAIKVLSHFNETGYNAYLVGGSVRDLLLGDKPKDFDVVSNALPEEVRQLFRNSRLIGRRFRLAHVYFHGEIIEVSTLRGLGEFDANEENEKGKHIYQNVYGESLEEDAMRRDFTVNALYYDMEDGNIIDYVGGMKDLKHKIIRIIGDPAVRFREDAVRILRAIRLAAKLKFKIEEETAKEIHANRALLKKVPPARLLMELIKLFHCGNVKQAFELLQAYNLLNYFFPAMNGINLLDPDAKYYLLTYSAFESTDQRLKIGKSLNPAFLIAVLLWPYLQYYLKHFRQTISAFYPALFEAMEKTMRHQMTTFHFPRRLTGVVREIWLLQYRLAKRFGKYAFRNLYHPRFRAAYDFLLLRANAEPELQPLCEWWSEFQSVTAEEKKMMLKELKIKK